MTPPLRLEIGYVPGLQPDKWLQRARERMPRTEVQARRIDQPATQVIDCLRRTTDSSASDRHDRGDELVDVLFVREHDDAPRSAPAGVFRIPLYTETMAVLAAKGHEISAFEAVDVADLHGETWLPEVDAVSASFSQAQAAVELVAANVGLLVLPQPYARLLNRRDVINRPLTGVPATRIGIAWAREREDDAAIEQFVGIVRGRTANSSRGKPAPENTTGPRAHTARPRRTPPTGRNKKNSKAAPRRGRRR